MPMLAAGDVPVGAGDIDKVIYADEVALLASLCERLLQISLREGANPLHGLRYVDAYLQYVIDIFLER